MLEIINAYLTQNPCYTGNVNKADSRYTEFQKNGPSGGMLHSVGCAQPDASVFIARWNKPTYTSSCVHGVIDANSGVAYQTLPWNFRGWHCGGKANNYMIGIEMCESRYIKYTTGGKFTVLDKPKAQADCKRAYDTAVQLFAMLAKMWNWNPLTDIISHNEGGKRGIASKHIDPEHYWSGLDMPYTMDGFRADVKHAMLEVEDMTIEELEQFVDELIDRKFPGMWSAQYKKELAKLNDNDSSAWSKEAREWAVETGLINGVGEYPDGTTNYAWEQPLTREQYVTTEYRQHLNEIRSEEGDGDA